AGLPRWGDWLRVFVPVVLATAFAVLAWKFGYFRLQSSTTLGEIVNRTGNDLWLVLAFTAAYGVVAAFAAPVSPLAYAAGALFGIIRGITVVGVGSMIGGIAGYWLARGALAGATKRLLGHHEAKLRDVRQHSAFLVTLRTQLLPIVPFGVFNYAAGA